MPQWLSHRQALELISFIASGSSSNENKIQVLEDIYSIAHSLVAPKICFHSHKDSRDKWAKVYEKVKEQL